MMNHEAVKVLKSWVECLTTDCDDDCEHCHIQLDGVNTVIEACAVAITELSSPSRPKGRWYMVSQHGTPPTYVYSCSECRHKSFGFYNYCPNCGAYMHQPEEGNV